MSKGQRLERVERILDTLAKSQAPTQTWPTQLDWDAFLRRLELDPEQFRIELKERNAKGENLSGGSLLAEKLGISGQELVRILKEKAGRL